MTGKELVCFFKADECPTIRGFRIVPWSKGKRKRVFVNGYYWRDMSKINGYKKYRTCGYFNGVKWRWFASDFVPQKIRDQLEQSARAMFKETFGGRQ